jgi:hypothetical protein
METIVEFLTFAYQSKGNGMEGELNEVSTTEDFSVVQQEGSREVCRTIKHYNLDLIIAVGYL